MIAFCSVSQISEVDTWQRLKRLAINFQKQESFSRKENSCVKNAANGIKFDYDQLIFYVNGRRIVEKCVDPRISLATYLRDHLKLTGTKVGCNEGGCGACTVTITDLDPKTGNVRHYSANACLTPVCAVFGKAVTSIEGIGNAKNLHPIQERLSAAHGTQCGYCTPGFVMAMYSHLKNNPHPTEKSIDTAIQGNLCRCTGYRPILDAFYSFANEENIGVNKDNTLRDKNTQRKSFSTLTNYANCRKYDPSKELDYSSLLKADTLQNHSFKLQCDGRTWYQPKTIDELLILKNQFPDARIICGNSEVGIEVKLLFRDFQNAINVREIPELRAYKEDPEKGVFVGTGYSLNEMRALLNTTKSKHPVVTLLTKSIYYVKWQISKKFLVIITEWKTKSLEAVIEMLHLFAGNHVRNTASIGGNIATASPISDLNPIWQALNAKIVLQSKARGKRTVAIDENFFKGYRKTVIEQDEVILGIWIPWSSETTFFHAYKQAQRREDDISIVTAAHCADIDLDTHIIKDIRISYGGMAPTTKLALNTMKKLVGKKWDKETMDFALDELSKEMHLAADVPGGMPRYRTSLALSFFFKFFSNILGFKNQDKPTYLRKEFQSALKASQIYNDVLPGQKPIEPVGRPLQHRACDLQVSGEAAYSEDIYPTNCLYMAFVQSPIACGTLDAVDYSEALKVPGVYGYIDHNDIITFAKLGHAQDSPVFVEDKISYHCQPVAAILADNHDTARYAASLVKVKCTAQKPILSTDDAIKAGSYLRDKPYLVKSDLAPNYGTYDATTKDWSKYDYVLEDQVRMGGQEHFYLETSNCVVFPREDNELEIYASTQSVTDTQAEVCRVLGLPSNKVTVKVRRIGGGFGGKESTSGIFAAPAAVAALKYKRPVKFMTERYDDMAITGTRHPYLCKYKLGLNKEGMIQNYECKLYSNCGHSYDISPGVMHRSLVFADGVYRFPNAQISGMMCKTNLASNTAFRGFGGPQGLFTAETMMIEAAEKFGFDHDELREKNFYKEGECTPFGMHLHRNNIRRCWDECKQLADYTKRRESVKEFNRNHQYLKRGIFITPTKFGIAFGIKHLNQAGATVNIYRDGTVRVAQAGMEMGQGLYTKMTQVAAQCLGVDVSKVFIKETSTETVPNGSPTAASSGSDLNGIAVKDACDKINQRLQPIKDAHPDYTWEQIVEKAYLSRVPLFSSGFGIIHSEVVDFESGRGAEMFGYCTYGAACSEVEVDCLTGDHKIIRSDIVMDVGESLNPAIDIGQIEGAFLQGYGLYTMEELKVRPNGVRLTRGPGNYKIPTADDAPREFNVKLLKGSSNPGTIFSSKALAIGEPPLFLGVSAFFAIREAIKAYRKQNNVNEHLKFDAPATPEKIRLCCEDQITNRVR
uniref:xanthine dehydrogenase n=1 Tax=Syphacia muris TaxID=451379 RepID=A0A0N5AMQ3_9BILA